MKALLLSSYKNLELADLPAPSPAPDEVLIRLPACGICGSDVHGSDGPSGRRIPPIVMGHEAAGVIAVVGSAVKNFASGDRVTFDSTVYCGECPNCRRGNVNLCDRRQVLGVSCGDYRRAGAFAEFVAVPARILYRLPDNFPFAEAAMLEAVAVAIHGVNLALQKVVTRQIRLQGSCASAGEYPQAIESMASGKIQVKPLITAIAPLEEGPRWFERLHAREPNLLKVVLTPNAS